MAQLTCDEVLQIQENDIPQCFEEPNGFLIGLCFLFSKARVIDDSSYAAGHDVFYAYNLDELEDLTQDDVLKLNSHGWRYTDEFECWYIFV